MANYIKENFINRQIQLIDNQLEFAMQLLNIPLEQLIYKEQHEKWNALECIEHMNKSMNIYLKQFAGLALKAKDEEFIKIGLKGNFFAEGMRPKGEKISYKIKTMKYLEPDINGIETVYTFIEMLNAMKSFMLKNKDNSWNKGKVKTALGPLVKLNIGEAINFVLAHNERHVQQAKNSLSLVVIN